MADGAPRVSTQLALPVVGDYAYVAAHLRADDQSEWVSLTGAAFDADGFARAMLSIQGTAYVLLDSQGLPILLGGHEPIKPGVFQGWLAGTDAGWEQHGRSISRWCRKLQDAQLAQCRRVQIIARADRTHAHVWYQKALGMTPEGIHRAWFADGSDAAVFSRTQGDARGLDQ